MASTRRSWTSDKSSSRSRSHDHKRRKRRSTWSSEGSPSRGADASTPPPRDNTSHQVVLQPEKLVRSAKEIQRSVQQKLKERMEEEESMRKSIMEQEEHEKMVLDKLEKDKPEHAERSPSIDSSKFISPKRAEKEGTPDKLYSE